MKPRHTALFPTACLALALAAAPSLSAQEPSGAEKYFGNLELVDQNGETRRLYRDLLAGKVVAIDAIFTTCPGICPVMSKTLKKIQDRAGDRLGKDVHLLSISLDPETDTPEKMREYASRFGARDGWYFLTGEKANVEAALKKLGQYVEQKETHSAVIIVGNEATGLWKKAYGLASSEEVVAVFESVLEDRAPEAAGAASGAAGRGR